VFVSFYHVLNPNKHVFAAGEHVFADGEHVFADGEHVFADGEHVFADGEHVFADGEHVFANGEHVFANGEHVFANGEHVFANEEHVFANEEHVFANGEYVVADREVRFGRHQVGLIADDLSFPIPANNMSVPENIGTGKARHSGGAVVVNQTVLFGNGGPRQRPAGRGLPALPTDVPGLNLSALR